MYEERSALARTIDSLIRYAALAFVFVVPIIVFPAPWFAIPQLKMLVASAFIVFVLVMWLIRSVSVRRISFSLDAIVIASLLLPVAYAVSAYVSEATFSSFVSGEHLQGTVAAMLIFFGAVLVGAISVEDRRTSIALVLVLMLSGAIALAFQILRLFLPGSLDLAGALVGNTSAIIGTWHDLAIFSGLILLVSLGLIETSIGHSRVLAVFLRVLSVGAAAMLVVTNFADAWYAVSGAALLFAVSRAMRANRRQKSLALSARSAIFWLLLVLVSGLMGYFGTAVQTKLPAMFQIGQTEVRPSWEGTFAAGQNLYEGGKALVFGSGPNTFDRQWALFKPSEVNTTNFWDAEFQYGYGVVPTAIVTVGIVGTLMWVLLLFALLWTGFRSFTDENEGRLRAILFVGCAFLLFFHIIYVPSVGISLLMFLLLGVLAGLNPSSWRHKELSFAPASVVAFVLVLVVSCAVIAASLMESRAIASTLFTYRASSLYQTTGNISSAADLVNRSVQIDPKNDLAQRAAVQIGLLQFAELARSNATDEATREKLQKTLSDTIAHGLAAVSIDDSSYQNWLALAGLYQSLAGVGVEGAHEQAQTAWRQAASTTPLNPLPFVQLGQLAMAQGKNQEAAAYFSRAIELKPNLALPYYLRAQIRAGEQKYPEAIQDAVAAAQIANQDPLGWYMLGAILYAAADYPNAILALEKAVSLQNNYSDALFALSVTYSLAGDHQKALMAAQKVAELNPDNAMAAHVYENLKANKPALDGMPGAGSAQSETSADNPT